MPRLPTPRTTRKELTQSSGVLLVTRQPQAAPAPAPGQPGAASDYIPAEPEIFIAILADGEVLAFNGHVDLGTGIGTALGQIVAEELEVPFERVRVVLGHTDTTPNQGPTIASATIQISAVPLRRAAAQAREFLRVKAGAALGENPADLVLRDGVFTSRRDERLRVGYGALVTGAHVELTLADDVPLKPVAEYRIVGKPAARVDIPGKAVGALTYVHDMRLPGMLHGRVIRPPYTGRDAGAFIGHSLIAVDLASIAHIPSAQAVVIGDFVGVVAPREEHAIRAAQQLKVTWRPHPPLQDLTDLESILLDADATRRVLSETGNVDESVQHAPTVLKRSYLWPYQMHGSIGPSCALADYRGDGLTVWSGTQNPFVLRIDLARLLELDEANIEVVRMEAAGCYGRNCADDVAGDAALLSRSVGQPVRVQLSREQEHGWEPKGAAQLVTLTAATNANGELLAYDFMTRYPSNDAPVLALLLTGTLAAQPRVLQMGDRTAVPPYAYRTSRIVCDDMAPIVRASWLRGVAALPNSFAHESMIDEIAHTTGADPVEFRLRHLDDQRAIDLVRRVAREADWQTGAHGSRGRVDADGLLRGRGFAYARYIHSKFPGFGAAWAAWAIELSVDPRNGRIEVTRIVVGQDTGMIVNRAGVQHQIHGNVIQCLSRVLKEEVVFDQQGVVSRDWGAYPILTFPELPPIEVILMERQTEPPLGAGESASIPGPAAVANALFDATGCRFRQPPFLPEKILATLASHAVGVVQPV